jgi:ABC-type sugar transport system substrate-binding protein
MKKALSFVLFAAALLAASAATAQNPNYTPGPVWRVTYYSIKPGQGDAFWKDVRDNTRPVYDDFKKAGLISEYKFFTNPVSDHPNDWDVAFAILYPNWAAIDELDAKGATIATKHYGSREAMIEAGKKRSELREVIASHLAREVMLK